MEKKKEAYFIDKTRMAVMCIIAVLLIIIYIMLLYNKEVENSKMINAIIDKQHMNYTKIAYVISCLEVVITVLVTIIVSSIISTFLISKKDNSKIYNEAIDDFLSGSKVKIKFEKKNNFYEKKYYKELKTKKYPQAMIESALSAITETDVPFYYKSCEMEIDCRIEDGFIVKTVKKSISVLSYEKSCMLGGDDDDFILVAQSGYNGIIKPLEIQTVRIQGKTKIDDPKYKIEQTKNEAVHNNLKYEDINIAYLKEKIRIEKNEPTIITVVYKTTVPPTDLDYIFRIPCACQNFSLKFYLKNMPKYKLNGYAFGFLDDASANIDLRSDDSIEFKFNNWIFKYDGVCILINDKQ